MLDVKDITEVEDFKTEKGDIDDYHNANMKSTEMDPEFKEIFQEIVNIGTIIDFDTNKPMTVKVTGMYQSRIPNNYNSKVFYLKDNKNTYYKLALLDFNDDDSYVYAKKVEDIDTDSIVAAIPPRTTKPKID